MNHIEASEKIVKQGSCEGVQCIECPANNISRPKRNECDFCRCFTTNESAIKFFTLFPNKIRKSVEKEASRSPQYVAGYNRGYKQAEKEIEVKVLEGLLNNHRSVISESKTLSTVIHERIKELKESK